jgi:hypothetical protein
MIATVIPVRSLCDRTVLIASMMVSKNFMA